MIFRGRDGRTPVRTLAAGLGALALVAGLGAPASGQQAPGDEYGESGVSSGVVNLRAESSWLPVGSAGGGGGGSSCTTSSVEVIVEDDFVQPVNRQWLTFGADGSIPFTAGPTDLPSSLPTHMRHFSPTGRWYAVMCDGVIQVVPEGGAAVTVAGLMLRALDQLDPPEPELEITPSALHYTQLQSWFAIEPVYWSTDRSETVNAGRVVVTAHANPYESLWDTGDGTVLTCGAGVVWQPGLADDATDCGHVYRQSSAGQPGDAFTVEATVHFEVTAETNAPGSYGPFPDLERTTSVSVQVGEIQAVND